MTYTPQNELSPKTGNPAWRLISTRPYTVAATIYLIFNAVRFMVIKDFSEWDHVFVLAARHLRDGADIYRLVPEAQEHAYSYPPFMALLAIPFTWLPAWLAKFIWFLITAVCAVLAWRWSWRLSGGGPLQGSTKPQPREHLICILGLACAMRFMQDNFEHRQADLLIAVLLLGGCILWQAARDLPAATCFALAGAMKGPPLLFAPYLLWRGRWVAAIWMIVLAVGVNLLPDLVHRAPHGLWLNQWYNEMIKPIDAIGIWHSSVIDNQSLAGAARRFFADKMKPQTLKDLVYAAELSLVILSAAIMGRPGSRARDSMTRPTPAILECCVVFGLMLLMSPMSSKPHFCVLILPAFCLARLAVERRDWAARIAVAACIILVVLLDRSIAQRTAGKWAMEMGAVMWGATALWAGCLAALTRRDPVKLIL